MLTLGILETKLNFKLEQAIPLLALIEEEKTREGKTGTKGAGLDEETGTSVLLTRTAGL